MFQYWGIPIFFALGVALLPQSWLPWGVLAFRRDWGFSKNALAAALATLVLTAGALVLFQISHALFGSVTPLVAAVWIAAFSLWRIWMSPRREELWLQGRGTRAPIALACILTGPSEIGAWVFSRAGSSEQVGAWSATLFLALVFQISRGQERLENQPNLLNTWLPETRVRAGISPIAWAPAVAAISFWAFVR